MRPGPEAPESALQPRNGASAEEPKVAQPRSRRALLTAALGGIAGAVAGALGRPAELRAAAGDPLVVGQQNYGGTAATRLTTNSSGGAFWLTQNGFGSGVRGDSVNGHGGVFNTQHDDRYGLNAANIAPSSGLGAAVNAAGGNNHGLVASTSHGSKYAVMATTSNPNPYSVAIYGEVSSTAALQSSAGVSGVNKGTGNISGVGVFGSHAGGGYGVQGFAASGYGVFGSSTTGPAGIHGLSSAAGGYGVQGVGNGQFGSGLNGTSSGSSGHGVSASVSTASSTASAIYGYGPDPAYAGYFEGKVGVVGTLSKSAGSFRIDHPLDPANRFLQHSFVESPDMKNVYDGVATTDDDGLVTVELPRWFEALNREFRYQLTALGGWTETWIEREIRDNRFTIQSRDPGRRVSWQVTGIRRDAYAEAHPIEVEVPKSSTERGRYLHPVEHGKRPSRAIGYEAQRRLTKTAAAEPGTPEG